MMQFAILDDHTLFANSIASFLSNKLDNVHVSEFNDPEEFLKLYSSYDLLLVDLEMPKISGVEVIKEVRSRNPNQKIMVLSMHFNIQISSELYKLDVNAFISKSSSPEKFKSIIEDVINGEKIYPEEFSEKKIEKYIENRSLLTNREIQILEQASHGKTSSEIGKKLFIVEGTVKTHIQHILRKTNSSNLKEAIAQYQKSGYNVLLDK